MKKQIDEDNKNLIKEFARDYSRKDEVFEKFYLQEIKEELLNISAREYDKKVQKIQSLIKRKDTIEHIKDVMLSYKNVKKMITNEAVKILPNEDFVKLKKVLDTDEKRYGTLLQQNEKLNDAKEKFKEIKSNMNFEKAKHESKKNIWKKEEQEQENKRKKWKLEATEHQKKRENWNNEKNKIQEEKESLEQEKSQAKSELSSLKIEIKEKTEIAKNERKKDGKIQKEALAMAIKELYEQNKTKQPTKIMKK